MSLQRAGKWHVLLYAVCVPVLLLAVGGRASIPALAGDAAASAAVAAGNPAPGAGNDGAPQAGVPADWWGQVEENLTAAEDEAKREAATGSTQRVKDINQAPFMGSSKPVRLVPVGGTIFFQAFDPAVGEELWKSDGTAAGSR